MKANRQVKYVPFQRIHPAIESEIVDAFKQFYRDQWYILGNRSKTFETNFAAYLGCKHVVGVASGHDALFLALKSLDIGDGDEVILPAHTFVATALAVVHSGASPILVDVDSKTGNIDPNKIEELISPRTRAIIPVHLYGNPCDMEALIDITKSNKLDIIEDFAQSHGAEFKGKKTGTIGHVNATSFYPIKNLGALGDAGAVTTNDDEIAEKIRKLRNYGGTDRNNIELPGYNSRLDELQAAILDVKLKYLDQWNAQRNEIAQIYIRELENSNSVNLLEIMPNFQSSYHIFPVLSLQRDLLRTHLKNVGIETAIHYQRPVHLHHAFQSLGYKRGDFPNAEKICQTELSLPLFPGMTSQETHYVCDQIKSFRVRA